MPRTVRVLVFGTFDLLHPGHRSFLRQAKKLGTQLTVAVGRDAVVRKLKQVRLHQNEQHRLRMVASVASVDRALLASKDPARRYDFIAHLRPDIIALGYDQTHYTEHLAAELKRRRINCRVVRLRPYRPRRYKSTLIRAALARSKKI